MLILLPLFSSCQSPPPRFSFLLLIMEQGTQNSLDLKHVSSSNLPGKASLSVKYFQQKKKKNLPEQCLSLASSKYQIINALRGELQDRFQIDNEGNFRIVDDTFYNYRSSGIMLKYYLF